jgi:hypothetical protein
MLVVYILNMSSDYEYIVYNRDMTRPKIKNNSSMEVHNIIKRLERKASDQIIFNESVRNVFSNNNNNLSEDVINECIHFYDDNQELIDNIIEEYSKLNTALYDQDGEYFDIKKSKENVSDLELNYFDVSVDVDNMEINVI